MRTAHFAADEVGARDLRPTRDPQAGPATRPAGASRVWVLACHREGDNAQMIGLAEALGWPFEVKRIIHRKRVSPRAMLLSATLASVDARRTGELEPPWPDLVIFAYHRNENVARWIREQSGGRTRLVLVGRPWSAGDDLDLIVTTPQLQLAERPNILHNALPLHRITPARLAAAAAEWGPRLRHLPRPFTAVLVGGSSGPYAFDRTAAERLGHEAGAFGRGQGGGSLLVTTSARTSRAAAEAVLGGITGPAHRHRWSPDQTENPYLGFLALADRIIVTGDSISMIAEACATRKPVRLFAFGGGPATMRPEPRRAGRDLRSLRAREFRPRALLYAWYMRLPRWRINRTRDLRLVHRTLVASGRVAWLGEAAAPPTLGPVPGDMARTVRRVAALVPNPPLMAPLAQLVQAAAR